jgi:hypothetical protein
MPFLSELSRLAFNFYRTLRIQFLPDLILLQFGFTAAQIRALVLVDV